MQAARLLGAERVAAACRDAAGRARAAELGADAVADVSGDDVDAIATRLAKATADRVDLVLDPVWGRPAEAAMRILSPHGRLVNLGSSAGPLASFSSASLRSGMQSVIGYTNNALSYQQKAKALGEILTHAAAGRLAVDHETMTLEQAADGWARTGQAPYRRAVLMP